VIIHYDPVTGEIGELAPDFEGEADPARMSLTMKKWTLVSALEAGKDITPVSKDKFGLTFGTDGQVALATDCNSMSGTYTAKGSSLSVGPMMSTMMYCDGSWESEFSRIIGETTGYSFTGKGELVLTFGKGGVATFR
jgi:heat shock protein HslJ